jgi:hypothetical protein
MRFVWTQTKFRIFRNNHANYSELISYENSHYCSDLILSMIKDANASTKINYITFEVKAVLFFCVFPIPQRTHLLPELNNVKHLIYEIR